MCAFSLCFGVFDMAQFFECLAQIHPASLAFFGQLVSDEVEYVIESFNVLWFEVVWWDAPFGLCFLTVVIVPGGVWLLVWVGCCFFEIEVEGGWWLWIEYEFREGLEQCWFILHLVFCLVSFKNSHCHVVDHSWVSFGVSESVIPPEVVLELLEESVVDVDLVTELIQFLRCLFLLFEHVCACQHPYRFEVVWWVLAVKDQFWVSWYKFGRKL